MKHGLIGGKWFPETAALFAAEGIDMDFSRRGFYDPEEWALLPSVASAFTLDSELYADSGAGYDASAVQAAVPAQKSGSFCQTFTVAPGTLRLRWDPSTRKGFAIRDLCAEFSAPNGRRVRLVPVGGNGALTTSKEPGLWIFLQDDPQLVFVVPRTFRACGGTLTLCGDIVCPISKELLYAEKNPPVSEPQSFFARLLGRFGKGW